MRLCGSIEEKKIWKLNILSRVTQSPCESRNCFSSSLPKFLNVSNNVSGLKELDFSARILNLMTGHLCTGDHLFLNVIKSVCTGTGCSFCSKCLILSLLLGSSFIAGVQLLKHDSIPKNFAALHKQGYQV